jgi:hypothetical protein
MKTYRQLIGELDSDRAHYSQELSEVDVSDADDVKVLATDPGGEVLVHLGASNFLDRFKIFKGHVQEWRQQFARLDSVDLRYDHQIVVNPDLQGTVKQPPLSMGVQKSAIAAGVRPAALVSHQTAGPAASSAGAVLKPISAKKNVVKKQRRHQAVLKRASAKHEVSAAPTLSAANTTARVTTLKTNSAPSTNSPAVPNSKPSPAIPKGQQQQ